MSLTDAASARSSQRGSRSGMSGGMPNFEGGMPNFGGGNMPSFGGGSAPSFGGGMPSFGGEGFPQMGESGENAQTAKKFNLKDWISSAKAFVMAWLYEGVDMGASQATGSLVKVEVGMQNDDYAEILSGVSEGQVVLYTGEEETTSSWGRGGMGGMGGMGMPMGF